MSRKVLIGFGVDVDAVAGWFVFMMVSLSCRKALNVYNIRLGSYGGEDSPLDISRVSTVNRPDEVVTHSHSGHVRRRSRRTTSAEAFQQVQHQDNLVHSWYLTQYHEIIYHTEAEIVQVTVWKRFQNRWQL